jgi:hypothetical protein
MRYASLSIGMKQLVAAAVLLAAAGTTAIAEQDEVNLQGNLYIGGKSLIDPPPNEPKNTHVYMKIEGPAALKVYRAMKGKEREDECLGDGWRTKSAGQMQCWLAANRKDANCSFGMDLATGRVSAGSVC